MSLDLRARLGESGLLLRSETYAQSIQHLHFNLLPCSTKSFKSFEKRELVESVTLLEHVIAWVNLICIIHHEPD